MALLQSPPLADLADVRAPLPELGDAEYVSRVLGRTGVAAEAEIEQELAAKAASLGIELPISAPRFTTPQPSAPVSDPPDALNLRQARTASAGSDDETTVCRVETNASHQSIAIPATLTESTARTRSRTLSFSLYEKYLSQIDPTLDQPNFLRSSRDKATGVVIRPTAKRGVKGFTRSIASRLRKRKPAAAAPIPCVCCREDFICDNATLQTLPCGHTYCRDCLAIMIAQSITDESKMPPRCCTQPIPSAIIKKVLSKDKQQQFLKAVLQYSTPWEARIFCPNAPCGEFISPPPKVDPKHPFEAVCRNCETSVCIMCKRTAHQLGQDCPEDRELDAVLKMGEQSGWRRCHKCRMLIELSQGCTHITCRCKAQFCYICGAVWDPVVGCPNFCNGEEELERRRVEAEARLAELEAEKLAREKAERAEEAARQEAEERTMKSSEFKALREQQEAEMARFRDYERQAHAALRARQSNRKLALLDRFSDLAEKMRERHAKTEQHLEELQLKAEIELQNRLDEKEAKVRLKLKYMEDYCHGAGGGTVVVGPDGEEMPVRQVTERDLEQLRQQYCVRDGMERRHQSQINGLREKQAKSMEELVERHERERGVLADRRAEEIEDLAVEFANEAEVLAQTFAGRRARLEARWVLAGEMLRVEMERRTGKRFAPAPAPKWPESESGVVAASERGVDEAAATAGDGYGDDGRGEEDSGVVVVVEEGMRDIIIDQAQVGVAK